MLKTIGLFKKSDSKAFKTDDNKIVDGGGSRTNKTVVNSSRNLTCISNIEAIREPIFLTSNAKKTFNHLRQAFIKTPIL